MSIVKTKAEVRIYEAEGKEIEGLEYPVIHISSHWDRDEMVEVSIAGGKKVTVTARDLVDAVRRCSG